jgi:hypothetical protein
VCMIDWLQQSGNFSQTIIALYYYNDQTIAYY